MKLTVKEVQEIMGFKAANLPDEQKQFINAIAGGIADAINKSNDGILTADELAEKLKSVNRALKFSDIEGLDELKKENEDLIKQVKSLATALDKLQKKGLDLNPMLGRFDEEFTAMWDSPKFQDFVQNKDKRVSGFSFKGVSLGGNFVSDHDYSLTGDTGKVVSKITDRRTHIRDFATVIQGDPEHPAMSWQEIYELDRNARYVAENGMLPESSFKITERTSEVRRVGTYFRMSKRMLKSRVYVRSFILNKIVSAIRQAEDFAILFGDGTGDNVKGITTYEGCKSVESIIKDTILTLAAGDITSIEEYGDGVVLTLAKPHDLLIDGLRITLANAATNTNLNGTFDVMKLNDTQLYIPVTVTNKAKFADDAALLTAKVNNGAFKAVESPNSIDALNVAVAVMSYAQFYPTTLILNPITVANILTEKNTLGDRLDVVREANGSIIVGGLRVQESTLIPVGSYFLGDMGDGANIVDYTALNVEWADDVDTKLKNQIVLMAQEELIVPVYCPWAFAYGKLSELKTAITKTA